MTERKSVPRRPATEPVTSGDVASLSSKLPRPPTHPIGRDEMLVEILAEAWPLAGTLVLARAIKDAKKKGRPPSAERLRKRVDALRVVAFLEAARATETGSADTEHHALRICRYLRSELAKATRGRGRPKRGEAASTADRGMLVSVATPLPNAPPPPESLLRKFYGMKVRVYIRRKGMSKSITLADALQVLARDPDIPRHLRTPIGLTKALDQIVSDRSTARLAKAEALFGVGGDRLARRMQRARKVLPVTLPVGGI